MATGKSDTRCAINVPLQFVFRHFSLGGPPKRAQDLNKRIFMGSSVGGLYYDGFDSIDPVT